jgi:Mrp family chromosome partitioning ATPase
MLSIRGNKVGLMDVDLHGPSIPNMLKISSGMNIKGQHELSPFEYSANLGVISMGMILQKQDEAVIWRGPLKISAIRQFISDVTWGELDFLIVDSPPGTGDEPLTVANYNDGGRYCNHATGDQPCGCEEIHQLLPPG